MSIQLGDSLPDMELQIMGQEGPEKVATRDLFAGKRVVLFAVPGAFTPGCTQTHLPGFVVKADEIKARGVDQIICTAVNDIFVLDAWARSQNAEHILMLADGQGDFAATLGLDQDLSAMQMGKRSQRYAMIVDDGRVEALKVDPKGVDQSSADSILEELDKAG
ncbi:peroxiredoxin [Marinospirillum perlucidum]|uniref:peroxiredoxin n=1 Tax=Marinospirillum perlucidum TaxID=1982602 RepID=UPI000DF3B99B|nr:peroxiredoxin [Marinospirillum perlucidum]